jgi:hypothetical protein
VKSNLILKNRSLKESHFHKIISVSSAKIKINPIEVMKKNLNKYNIKQTAYDKKIITNILYDERKHIVSVFKENLIWDDMAEFLIK